MLIYSHLSNLAISKAQHETLALFAFNEYQKINISDRDFLLDAQINIIRQMSISLNF